MAGLPGSGKAVLVWAASTGFAWEQLRYSVCDALALLSVVSESPAETIALFSVHLACMHCMHNCPDGGHECKKVDRREVVKQSIL